MINKISLSNYFLIIPLLVVFSSCSSNSKDKKATEAKEKEPQAISVFQNFGEVKIDDSLAKIEVKIPAPKPNSNWFGSNNDNNQKIENFAFANKINKKKSFFAGYRFAADNSIVFAPIIADNKIYLFDGKGNLAARNLDNYKLIWKRKIIPRSDLKDFAKGKISYRNGKIFLSSGYDFIAAIDSQTGKIIWQKNLGAILISAAIADDDQVFIITNDNKTYALDVANGAINWIHSGIMREAAILGAANPVFYHNYVAVSYSSGEIYLLDKRNGETSWSYDLNLNQAINSNFILNDIDATPVIKNDVLYAIGNGGLMMAIDIRSGNILWQKELASISDFWVAGDFIYLINNDNQLICLEKKSGRIKWFTQLKKYRNEKNPASKIVYNGLIMAGGNLVISDSNREILLISPFNGQIIQKTRTIEKIYHTPIIVDGKIYLHLIGRFSINLMVME